jgi:hypothetical protein
MTKEEFEKIKNKIIVGLIILFLVCFSVATLKEILIPYKPISKFEVVDTYNECSVVRYTSVSDQWIYFLDCSNKKTL